MANWTKAEKVELARDMVILAMSLTHFQDIFWMIDSDKPYDDIEEVVKYAEDISEYVQIPPSLVKDT